MNFKELAELVPWLIAEKIPRSSQAWAARPSTRHRTHFSHWACCLVVLAPNFCPVRSGT
jgi:hypothetical protein